MKDELADDVQILLVENDPDTRTHLTNVLKVDGHCVRAMGSFDEIRLAGPQPSIDLVILERKLPDGNAEEAVLDLKRLLPNAEFMVVTGQAELDHTITAIKLGVVDFIVKPIQPEVIRQSVARFVRQRNSDAARDAEHRFANEVLKTAEAIIMVLDLAGHVVHFNPFFTKITGWSLESLQGKDWFATCIPEEERGVVREVFIATARDIHTNGVINPVLTSDGRKRQIRWSNTTLRDHKGDATSVLAIGVDITELIAAQESAMQSHRLAAIGQTVTGLAHESRNALQRIQSSVELLSLDIPPQSQAREELDSIRRASNELNNILEEVRQYAAPIHLHREPVELPVVWRRVWRNLEKLRADRDAVLVESNAVCVHSVNVDVLRMEQVFRNLFENSLSACSDPVRVQVSCICDGPDAVLLDIQDNGPGLSAEQREKLFEPFFTTKTRGTGLGMSIAQRIVEAHSGDIQVADPLANNGATSGARFTIRLPKHKNSIDRICCLEK